MQACTLCLTPSPDRFFAQKHVKGAAKIYWECACCRLVFLSPRQRLTRTEERARYDLHRNGPEEEGYVRFLSRLALPLAGRLSEGAQGLDYGCGPGPALDGIFGKAGFQVANYDPFYFPEEALLEKRYDFVTCTEAAEHFFEPRREFLILDRLLRRPCAYVGIMTEILEEGVVFEKWWYPNDPTHVTFYRRETFEWIGRWLVWTVEFPERNVIIFKKSAGHPDTKAKGQ